MVAATKDRNTESKHIALKRYKLAASTTIFKGTMVCLNSSGLAIPAAAASGNQPVAGVALEGAKSAATGDTYVTLMSGRAFKFAGDTLQQNDVGKVVYADDDQTIDETQATNAPLAGILVEYESASLGWVYIPEGGARQSTQ